MNIWLWESVCKVKKIRQTWKRWDNIQHRRTVDSWHKGDATRQSRLRHAVIRGSWGDVSFLKKRKYIKQHFKKAAQFLENFLFFYVTFVALYFWTLHSWTVTPLILILILLEKKKPSDIIYKDVIQVMTNAVHYKNPLDNCSKNATPNNAYSRGMRGSQMVGAVEQLKVREESARPTQLRSLPEPSCRTFLTGQW